MISLSLNLHSATDTHISKTNFCFLLKKMKILITSLLLITGLNQILARSLPWSRHSLDIHGDFLDDDDYDLFNRPKNQENFFKLMMDESNEESKEFNKPDTSAHESDHLGDFFGTLLGSILDNSEEDTNSDENTQVNSSEKKEENDDKKEEWEILLGDIFGITIAINDDEKKSSEETETKERKIGNSNENSEEVNIFDLTNSSEEKSDEVVKNVESSEESVNKEDKSDENSKEQSEVFDMTINASKQQSTEVVNDLTEREVNELASFIMTLNILNDMGDIINSAENKDNISRAKEVDEILMAYGEILNKMIEDDMRLKNMLNHNKEQNNSNDSNENKDDQLIKTNTAKKDSDEEDNSNETLATTSKNYSNEKEVDSDQSNSSENENDFKIVSIVLQGGGEEKGETQNLNDHKYSVIDSQLEFKPTSAPFKPESLSTSSTIDQNSIHEYVEIREALDTQQDSLQQHELDLDRDFYNIISNNYDDESLNKFEKDIHVVHENLDRIKRNINAMQNLQTKLYFHKLVTSAVQNAQNKSKN